MTNIPGVSRYDRDEAKRLLTKTLNQKELFGLTIVSCPRLIQTE
jgi:hypothetical protein